MAASITASGVSGSIEQSGRQQKEASAHFGDRLAAAGLDFRWRQARLITGLAGSPPTTARPVRRWASAQRRVAGDGRPSSARSPDSPTNSSKRMPSAAHVEQAERRVRDPAEDAQVVRPLEAAALGGGRQLLRGHVGGVEEAVRRPTQRPPRARRRASVSAIALERVIDRRRLRAHERHGLRRGLPPVETAGPSSGEKHRPDDRRVAPDRLADRLAAPRAARRGRPISRRRARGVADRPLSSSGAAVTVYGRRRARARACSEAPTSPAKHCARLWGLRKSQSNARGEPERLGGERRPPSSRWRSCAARGSRAPVDRRPAQGRQDALALGHVRLLAR